MLLSCSHDLILVAVVQWHSTAGARNDSTSSLLSESFHSQVSTSAERVRQYFSIGRQPSDLGKARAVPSSNSLFWQILLVLASLLTLTGDRIHLSADYDIPGGMCTTRTESRKEKSPYVRSCLAMLSEMI